MEGERKNNNKRWYFTREQLENSPSRRFGLDPDEELSCRQQAANLLQDMGQRLNVYPCGLGLRPWCKSCPAPASRPQGLSDRREAGGPGETEIKSSAGGKRGEVNFPLVHPSHQLCWELRILPALCFNELLLVVSLLSVCSNRLLCFSAMP